METGTSLGSPAPRPRSRKLRILLVLVILALLAVLVPSFFNVNRFKGRIAGSMEQALGRKVTVGEVSLRLLPRPGFDLRNLVIAEDPAFGAEPMLRADRVAATLRLTSLWRGRLEVARLTLQSGSDINPASLNLVQGPGGRWNIETLLQRASQTPAAPTAQSHAEARPRFPYIEADGGRINFKIGQEKKVYALVEGDFALWLAAENEWMFRLSAKPVRTDLNQADAGVLKVNGRFRRAANLQDTPVEITAALQDAQLGQLSKFLYGRDRGWRGALDVTAQITGTPAALKLATRAAAHDVRRYDINTTEKLGLDARCSAAYSTVTAQLSNVDCRMPLGDGALSVQGGAYGFSQPRVYDLNLTAENVPLQALVAFARHAKQDVPTDLRATGVLNGAFNLRDIENGPAFLWDGEAHTSEAVLYSSVLSPELTLPAMNLEVKAPAVSRSSTAAGKKGNAAHGRRKTEPKARSTQLPLPRLTLASVKVPLGTNGGVDVEGWVSGEQYTLSLAGDTRIARVLQVGRALGLRVPQYRVDGNARVNLELAGNWAGFANPTMTGTAQLRTVELPMRGLNEPVQIPAAGLVLTSDSATLQNLTARFPESPVWFSGWLRIARGCESLEQCPISFDLQSDDLAVDEVNRLLNPAFVKRPWYDVFGAGGPRNSTLGKIQARGRVSLGRLSMRSLSASRVSANVQLDRGKLAVTDLRADMLGGKQQGEWRADFTGAQPLYEGRGTLTGVAMAQVSALMRDSWAGGVVGGSYKVAFSGRSAAELGVSAKGTFDFDWRRGVLRHVALNSGPLQFRAFSGQLALQNGELKLAEANMATSSGSYVVNGTASLGRELRVSLRNRDRVYTVSGPLEKPRVAEAPEQQATVRP